MKCYPTLDDMERRPDGPHGHGPVRSRDNRDPETVAKEGKMGSGDCWCGKPGDHPWPGKADGAPHPRQLTTEGQDHYED